MNTESQKIIVTKLQAALRQLHTAIDLFFSKKDPISIHTLASAANELFDALCKHNDLERSVLYEGLKEIKPEYHKKIIDGFNKAKNYFKHADRDAQKMLEWQPDLNEFIIWDCCSLLRRLTNDKMSCEVLVFSSYFRIKYDELWRGKVVIEEIDKMIPIIKPLIVSGEFHALYPKLKEDCKKFAHSLDL